MGDGPYFYGKHQYKPQRKNKLTLDSENNHTTYFHSHPQRMPHSEESYRDESEGGSSEELGLQQRAEVLQGELCFH